MSKESTIASSSPQLRLPVHSRRRRVLPENRKRVVTACNNCNVRRTKCSGEQPCAQCRNTSRDCHYPATIEKVSIPKAELEQLRTKCAHLEMFLEQIIPEESNRRHLLNQLTCISMENATTGATTPDINEDSDYEERGLMVQDLDGALRYQGATSSTVFIQSVKSFLQASLLHIEIPPLSKSSSSCPQRGYGMRETCAPNPQKMDPFWHPPKEDMALMLARLRYTVQDGCGDFASGGIYYWGDFDMSFFDRKTTESSAGALSARELSLFHAASAMATALNSHGDSRVNRTQHGEAYFARARMLLGNPLNATLRNTLDIPVLSMMGMYLIEMNQRDTAYMYVSVGIHISIMHGIHKGYVQDECCKRSFWTLYVLDRWLSAIDGRQPSISDEAISLPPPVDVSGLPPTMGLRAHIELARISGCIFSNTYRVSSRGCSRTGNTAPNEKAFNKLLSWENRLPPELRIDGSLSHDRACYELHMNYNQLLISTTRPVFFEAVKKAVTQQYSGGSSSSEADCHPIYIETCTEAARRILQLARYIRELCQSSHPTFQMLHSIRDAAVILMVGQLLAETHGQNTTTDRVEIVFAMDCFNAEDLIDSRCHKEFICHLQELQALVENVYRSRTHGSSWTAGSTPSVAATDAHTPAETAYHVGFILDPSDPHIEPKPPSTSDELVSQLASWTNIRGHRYMEIS